MNRTTKTLSLVLIFVVGMVACKKDYDCKCTATILGVTGDSTIKIEKAKKKDAKSKCDNYSNDFNSQAQQFGGSASCSID